MRTLVTIISLFICLSASSVSAQSHAQAYIKFDGIDGEGDLQGKYGHNAWSEVGEFSQSIQRPSDMAPAGHARVPAVLGDVQVAKKLDNASTEIARAACKGTVFREVKIDLVKNGVVRYSYKLTDVVVSGYSIQHSGTELPGEEISLSFGKMKVEYTGMDAAGHPKAVVLYEWKR